MMYVEIADAINDKILTGVYQAGRRVPSIRLTALDFQVNHNTQLQQSLSFAVLCHTAWRGAGTDSLLCQDHAPHIPSAEQRRVLC